MVRICESKIIQYGQLIGNYLKKFYCNNFAQNQFLKLILGPEGFAEGFRGRLRVRFFSMVRQFREGFCGRFFGRFCRRFAEGKWSFQTLGFCGRFRGRSCGRLRGGFLSMVRYFCGKFSRKVLRKVLQKVLRKVSVKFSRKAKSDNYEEKCNNPVCEA